MRTYDLLVCSVCKRTSVYETGSNGSEGWARIVIDSRETRTGCPDHAAVLVTERAGRSNESLEVIATTLHLAAQHEDGETKDRLIAATAELTEAIRVRRERDQDGGRP